MKLVVTVVLFVLVLRRWRIAPAPLFLTYMATFLVYWLALARTFRTQVQQQAIRSMEHRDP
jgi:F0F1-type ATP synthase assembly protein I